VQIRTETDKIQTIDDNVDAIKAKTDNLPADPTSETNATANKNEIVTDIDDVKGTAFVKDTDSLVNIRPETDKIQTIDDNVDAIKLKTDNLPADPASETNVDAAETAILNDHTVMKQKAAGSYDRETDSLEALSEQIVVIDGNVDDIELFVQNQVIVGFDEMNFAGIDIFNYAMDNVEFGFWVQDRAGNKLIGISDVAANGTYIVIRYRQGSSTVIDSGALSIKSEVNNLKFYFNINIKLGDWIPGDMLAVQLSGSSLLINTKTYYLPVLVQIIPLTGDQIAASGNIGASSTTTVIDTALSDSDDYYNGMQVAVIRPNAPSSDNKMVVRNIVDFESSTGYITVDKALPFTPTTSDRFFILGKVSGSNVPDLQDDIDVITGKLPTNFIMGSSVQSDKDDEIDAIKADVTRVLGLVNENVVMEHNYDVEDKHTGWTVWIYDSKTNADSHDKSTGLLETYTMTVTYDASDNPTVTKIVRNP
jgi:hypothetical protein